jgi:hypothetical protein
VKEFSEHRTAERIEQGIAETNKNQPQMSQTNADSLRASV